MRKNLWDTLQRHATPEDIDQIVELEQLSYDDCYTRDAIEMLMESQTFYVNTLEDQVLGYVTYKHQLNEQQEDCICIYRLAVHPSCRHRGIGWRLVDFVVGVARTMNKELEFVLMTDDLPIASQCFLAAMKFERVREAGIVAVYSYAGDKDE